MKRTTMVLFLAVDLAPLALRARAAPQRETRERPIPMERNEQSPARPRKVVVAPPVTVTTGPYTSVQMNVDLDGHNIVGDAANEPSIAVDPRQPARIATGWRQFDSISSNFRQAGWAFSHDSGATWRFPGVLEPGVFRSDPVLDADLHGRFFYYSFTDDFTCDMWLSDFSAVSWLPKIPAFGGDKAWIVADKTSNVPGTGNVYVTWSPGVGCCGVDTFTRSLDGGFTWSPPVAVPYRVRWGNLVVDGQSNVYVAGIRGDIVDYASTLVIKSFDAKNAGASPSFPQASFVDLGGPAAVSGRAEPGGARSGCGWPQSSSNSVYLLASVDPPGGADPLDVRFARSDDGGVTWSASVRVNDDAPGTDAAGSDSSTVSVASAVAST
ncbi:MAG: sialidase family protein [Planctomycetota bacterium]